MDNEENEDFEVEIDKTPSERFFCAMCGKESVFFTDDDWLKFRRLSVCFRCFVEKVQ
jgi:hypothetical protein